MAITTVAVTCRAFGQDGEPIQGAVFTAVLNKVEVNEIHEGLVVPQVTTATTNASGVAILNLWPNELGIRGSSYFVTGTYPDAVTNFLEETAVIQNADCNLEDAIQIETAPPLIPVGHVGAGGVENHALAVAGGAAGFMSGLDKTKLNGIAVGATANLSDTSLLLRPLGAVASTSSISGGVITETIDGISVITTLQTGGYTTVYGAPISKTWETTISAGVITTEEVL